MTIHMQVFLTNMAWLAAAMTLVVIAFTTTGSLHSFWFLGVYIFGHSYVSTMKPEEDDDG